MFVVKLLSFHPQLKNKGRARLCLTWPKALVQPYSGQSLRPRKRLLLRATINSLRYAKMPPCRQLKTEIVSELDTWQRIILYYWSSDVGIWLQKVGSRELQFLTYGTPKLWYNFESHTELYIASHAYPPTPEIIDNGRGTLRCLFYRDDL